MLAIRIWKRMPKPKERLREEKGRLLAMLGEVNAMFEVEQIDTRANTSVKRRKTHDKVIETRMRNIIG